MEPKLLADHIQELAKRLHRTQFIVFVERNLDETRPTRIEELTLRLLANRGMDMSRVFFASSPYKSRPNDTGTGVHTDHNVKCWAVYHLNQLIDMDKIFVWRDMICVSEHPQNPKLANLKNYLSRLEWVPTNGRNSTVEDGDCTPSGKQYNSPDDVAISTIFVALWTAVHQSSPTIRLFNPLSNPIAYPTQTTRKIVSENLRRVLPVTRQVVRYEL